MTTRRRNRRTASSGNLVLLAEVGNKQLAQDRLGLHRKGDVGCDWAELCAVDVPTGIYGLIVDPLDVAILDRVTVEDDPGPPIGDPEFQTVVEEARQCAWSDVGGTGNPAPGFLRLRYCQQTGIEVRGSSIGLAAWIAFVEHFSGLRVPRLCVATGWPGRPLGAAEAKQAAVQREQKYLGDFAFVLAGDGFRVPPDSPGQRVQTREEAASAVWGFVPWLADQSDLLRLQVQCGDRPPPPNWESLVVAPGDLAPEGLHEAVTKVVAAIRKSPRVALRIAGPLVLGAALGHKLRNVPTQVVLFHREEPWWTNQTRFGRDLGPADCPNSDRRIVFTTNRTNGRDGDWEIRNLASADITRSNLPRILSQVRDICADPKQRLHLATTCGQAFAFALGDMFARSRHVVWYQYRADTSYLRWFANFEDPWRY